MAARLRDLLVLLMVMWIPTSIVLFVRHSNQMQTDIQTDLLRTLREEQEKLHGVSGRTEPPPAPAAQPALRGLEPLSVQTNDREISDEQGWPEPPTYDLHNRALEVTDLPADVQKQPWLSVCSELVNRNRPVLNKGMCCIIFTCVIGCLTVWPPFLLTAVGALRAHGLQI